MTALRVAYEPGPEDIVSKRAGSRYASGASSAWLKTICWRTDHVIVTDFAEPDDDAPVLVVARDAGGHMEPAGHVSLTGDRADEILDSVKERGLAVRKRHKGGIPVATGISLTSCAAVRRGTFDTRR